MIVNLLTDIKEKIPVMAIQSISGLLGENSRDTAVGLDYILPYVLREVCEVASTEQGISLIENLSAKLKKNDLLDNLSTIFSNDMQGFELIQSGTKQVNSLIGATKLNAVVEKISTETGIKKSSIASLLGVATPIILQKWRENVFKLKSGEQFLVFLERQKEEAEKYISPSLKAEFLEDTTPVETPLSNIEAEEINTKPLIEELPEQRIEPRKFSLMPWVLAGILGLGALFLLRNYKPTLEFLNNKFFATNILADSTALKKDTIQLILDSPLAQDFKEKGEKKSNQISSKNSGISSNTGTTQPKQTTKTNTVGTGNGFGNSASNESFNVGNSWQAFSSRDNGAIMGIANYLKSNPNRRVKIAGEFYTEKFDSDCSIRDRKKASFNSACGVKRKLQKQGIAANRIEVGTVNNSFRAGNVAVKTL